MVQAFMMANSEMMVNWDVRKLIVMGDAVRGQ
jgi:hypothetical protein